MTLNASASMIGLPSEGRAFDRTLRCQRAPVTPCLRRARSATGASDSEETGMDQRSEVWKACVEFHKYEVSSHGRVRRSAPSPYSFIGRILTPRKIPSGYWTVYIEGAPRLIHRLVVESFIGPLGKGHARQTNHINGINTDNRVENLEIVTASENSKHSHRIGTSKGHTQPRPSMWGSRHPRAVFNEAQVIEIRRRVSAGERQILLAKEFGVSPATLNKVVKGRSFAYLQPEGGVTK